MFTYKGVKITVTPSGRFFATINDAEISAESLAAAKMDIDRELANATKRTVRLPVVGVMVKQGREPEKLHVLGRASITGINRTTRELQFEGIRDGFEMVMAMPDTPDNATLTERWIKAHRDSRSIDKECKPKIVTPPSGYGRIPIIAYDGLIDELKARYEAAKGDEK